MRNKVYNGLDILTCGYKAVLSIKQITITIVSITLFMDTIDSNVLNTALPVMSRSFHVNPVDLKVALISYLLSFAIFIPMSGWAADQYGSKPIFISALLLFTVTSFFCGYATTLDQIVIARFIQGIGGAFMVSLGRLMIARTFKRNELVEAMNIVIIVVSLGVMMGPYVGGVIVDHWNWSWIFWVNIPVGIMLLIVSTLHLKDYTPRNPKPFDGLGFILFGGGLSLLCFSLSEMSESNINWTAVLLRLAIAIGMLITYFIHATKHAYPIIQTRLLYFRTFRISIIGNLCSRLGFGGIPFLLPLMQQISFGFSAQLSGLLLIPIALGIIFSKIFAIKLLRKTGYRRYLIGNTFIVGCILCLFTSINATTPIAMIALMTFTFGVFISAQYTAMNSLAFSEIADEKLSASTSITSTVQILGQSLGVAAGAIFLRFYSFQNKSDFTLSTAVFHKAFITLGIITFLSIFVFFKLQSSDGSQMLVKEKHE